MSTIAATIFSIALVPYILTWHYINQLVKDVNSTEHPKKISVWRWHKGWRLHAQFFPVSSVRLRLVLCIALTTVLGLAALAIEARNLFLQVNAR